MIPIETAYVAMCPRATVQQKNIPNAFALLQLNEIPGLVMLHVAVRAIVQRAKDEIFLPRCFK